MTQRPVPALGVAAVCAMLVATALVLSWQGLALAGDGSYYLVRILRTGEFFGADPRVLGNVVRQTPVLVGAKAGVTDTHVLTLILGFGQLVIPALVWAASVILSRGTPLAFAAVTVTAGVCAAATWFCSVSESVLALPLTALVAVLLSRTAPWGWRSAALAAAASLILIASYETAVATAAISVVWAFARTRTSTSVSDRAGGAIVTVASLAAIGVAVAGSFSEQNDSNSRSFLYFVVSLEPTGIYVLLLCGAVLVAALATADRRAQGALLALSLGGMVLAAARLDVTPSTAYAARGAAVVAVIALQCFLAALWYRDRRRESPAGSAHAPRRSLLWAPVAFVAVMSATNLAALADWSRSLDAFRAEVTTADGLVFVDEVLPADRRRVVWGWTGSSLSLVVRADPSDGILVDRDPSYVPFPPEDSRAQLPDRYVWRR